MTSGPGAGNDVGHFLDLGLGTAEGTELEQKYEYFGTKMAWTDKTYPLLCELTGTLVLGVAEQFNDTALVWGETVVEEKYSSARVQMTEPPMYVLCDGTWDSRSSHSKRMLCLYHALLDRGFST